ncbi:uncharacterized protein LOC132700683 [Cylas formicarius]|uniref:uncharacterized protein LOC132700683 n=1 Tax=Cylas formicarius TaxID=197179 RepID=UPI0029583EB3|nr:uncharacterized protein LOC132700683 [Cylas formicarius]
MKSLTILVVVACLIAVICGYRNPNTLEWADYAYNIDDGNCRGTRLIYEDVIKNADPYTVKKTTYNWDGRSMYHITCVRVHNRMPHDTRAAEARVTKGGVGQSEVKIEMISKNSEGLHFIVEIWGEEKYGSSQNIGLLMGSPDQNDRVLYVGKQKYCMCN